MTSPPAVDDDADLVTASLTDPDRFTAVYDRHFAAIRRYAAARLGPEVADDVAAETFLTAFRRRADFDPERGAPRAWLFGIATHLIRQHRRVEERRYRTLARLGPDRPVDGPEDRVAAAVDARDAQPRLAAALRALSAKERDVVLLAAFTDLGYGEIAEALGIPAGTVGSRLNRARGKLRAALPDTEGQ
ncbi:RNA polymerase sigma factor [Actinomadura rupiterrae]|uniref:RNA polymerase sigma factor n=1 Tax=Actinomadura rupiterrae TaxID=559627 RepID=UPI0020A342CB|nr:RNA polymerase sigma factor [Actinomadura rupiterrae]MCP2337757.1 RNA polymerase sigma-70 factor (ECF subfamily) [Actinomadura rupiterrae]